ncbi:MAG: hypothetical protein LHW51_12990 [Candidatus Cloacimonetes bacterium]|jgi:hypothetical protein|nr:hypothetical protein [Candidatus Cloacimonadota bacterium]
MKRMIIIIALLALCRFSFHLFANAHTFDWAKVLVAWTKITAIALLWMIMAIAT